MKKMNSIESKFQGISNLNRMIRLDENHPLDFFIGLNESGFLVLILNSNLQIKSMQGNKIIDIRVFQSENQYRLAITLKDFDYKKIYYDFVEDIVDHSNEKLPKETLIKRALNRIYLWKAAFKPASSSLLSESVIRGLVGELYFLKSYILENYGLEKAIRGWYGPKKYKRDFEINENWYEVKTKSTSSQYVKITSIEQLDVEISGTLAVISMDKTDLIVEKAYSLNQLIADLYELIDDHELRDIIYEKLDAIGYNYRIEYDEYAYLITNLQLFDINEESLILRKDVIPSSISSVKYSLDISQLAKKGD